MKRRTDLRKWSKDGTQRRCNICAEFFDLKNLNSNNKCKACNTLAKQAWVKGITKEFNLKVKQTKLKITQQYFEEGIKKCNTCFKIKPFNDFYPEKNSWDKLQNKCKSCTTDYNNTYNPYLKESNRIHRKKYLKEKYNNDLEYRLLLTLRNRINRSLQNKDNNSIELLGCSIEKWIVHLESQFDENMNWENYGKNGYWEIDHIIPLSKGGSFHYTNTQPLSIKENQKKGNKI
jgi:hypothetical protein